MTSVWLLYSGGYEDIEWVFADYDLALRWLVTCERARPSESFHLVEYGITEVEPIVNDVLSINAEYAGPRREGHIVSVGDYVADEVKVTDFPTLGRFHVHGTDHDAVREAVERKLSEQS